MGGMLLLSLCMWASYNVERFTIRGTVLTVRSMFQNRQFDVAELECLEWRWQSREGSIRFRVPGGKVRLDLYGYGKEDRLRIIRSLRRIVPPEVQEGWPLFCHKVALPLRDGIPSVVRSAPSSEIFTITRGRYDRMLVRALPLSVIVGVGLWMWLKLWQLLTLPLLVLVGWGLLRWSTPRAGYSTARLTTNSQGRVAYFALTSVVLSPAALLGLPMLGVRHDVACSVAIGILLPSFPIILYFNFKTGRQRRLADEKASAAALNLWQQGEADTTDSSAPDTAR